MGLEVDNESLKKRPGVLMVGSPNVGKRSLLSRLLGIDFEEISDSSSELFSHGWTIDTKYYTADVSVWMAHLAEGFSFGNLALSNNLSALVLVFDMNEPSSFTPLQHFISQTDIRKFEILLCIGNKADLLPGHPAHVQYRRLLQRRAHSSSAPEGFFEYGISESEGNSLLGDEEPLWDLRRSCLEWCIQYNIEYIEACASNADFDKCLSVDGDSQGVERLYGALSAHMWPGMILKSGNMVAAPYHIEKGGSESSEDESDYDIEYEILSAGSADPFDDTEVWVSASVPSTSTEPTEPTTGIDTKSSVSNVPASSSETRIVEDSDVETEPKEHEQESATQLSEDTSFGFEDIELLMNEIGNVRGNLRLMPDFQRREMAAKLAMRMASMFGESSGGEEEFDSDKI